MKYINLNFNSKIPEDLLQLKCKLKHFACGEFEFSVQEDISNEEIAIFQSFTLRNFNDDLIKLQIVCDVLKRNNVKKIIYHAPFLPYTRQDRTYDTTSSLGSKLIAEIINSCGISEVATYDLHAPQIEGFFKCKVQNLSMIPKFIQHIKENFSLENIVIVFPDTGSASRFKRFFVNEAFNIAIINKNRNENGIKMEILGNVDGKIGIIIDDMIDGGGTIVEASNILISNGINEVNVYATHGIFSANAIERLNESRIRSVIIGKSIAMQVSSMKIAVLSI